MISEVDIRDWEMQPLTKLYNVEKNTPIKTEDGEMLLFKHIDGMYSLCVSLSGEVSHIAAWEEVYPFKRNAK
jgi:hypothetical protein